MHPASCPICGAADISRSGRCSPYTLSDCGRCRLRWVEGVGEREIASFYDASYFTSDTQVGYRDYAADSALHRKNARGILGAFSELGDRRPARILDVGCGYGFLLDEARAAWGCEAVGIEISLPGRTHARDRLGLDILPAMDARAIDLDSVDACFLIGSIEHLLDPRAMLDDIRRVLKPGGCLVITTINTRGLLPLYAIKPPEHLYYFSAANLSLLLEQTGFRVEKVRTYCTNYYLHDLLHRLANFFGVSPLKRLSKVVAGQFPRLSLRIPTNEMIVLARKR